MLSFEQVLQLDAGRATRKQPLDSNLRRLKAEHLKQRGDAAINQGKYREAWERYTEAIELKPDKTGLHVLHGNRSLAYQKAQRYADALADANAAVRLAPAWHKGHWRRGAALMGLRRVPEAVLAYCEAWKLRKQDAECEGKLWQTVQRLTREQLGAAILQLFERLVAAGDMQAPQVEGVSEVEMVEAWFRLLQECHQGKPRPGPYFHRYLAWLKEGLSAGEAYTERSAMYCKAKCYLQARADARAAIALLIKQQQAAAQSDAAAEEAALQRRLAAAYLCLGRGCMAEPGHADRNCKEAAKAFIKGSDLDPASEGLQEGLREAGEELSKEEVEALTVEVYNEGASGSGLRNPGALGFADAPQRGQRVFRVELTLAFPQAKGVASLTSRARELLRAGLAAAAGVDARRVAIERVLPPTAGRQHLGVGVHVQVGSELLRGNELVKAVQGDAESLGALLGGQEVTDALGQPDPGQSSAELVDITPACAASDADRAAQNVLNEEHGPVPPEEERRLAVPARPKMDMELPYKLYRLVRADGSLPERTDKHPFCMSRVYYDANEKPEEVWAELLDGSCRWRQTGSEVKVMVLKVPQQLCSGQLSVTIEPYYIKVSNKGSGEVYLEGDLERGVVPEDCFWTHCQGEGEDGCMLYLRKMNLELLQRHWLHNEMWWPRLFRHHGEIAWDDYEKDYSDLPEPVLQRHRLSEAIKDGGRQTEQIEKERRDVLQERDDVRKRARQERLNELRSGTIKSWVQLYRENPMDAS